MGALAAYQRAGKAVHRDPWLGPLLMTLDMFMRAVSLLNVARTVPDMDVDVIDAGWKRCGEVRLPQNVAAVRSFWDVFRTFLQAQSYSSSYLYEEGKHPLSTVI